MGFKKGWVFGFALAFLGMMMMVNTIAYLVLKGVGIWGNNIPVGWAFDIINFVWWIGIGHAGHADFGDPAAAAPIVADVDQPLRRSDDAVRRGLRGSLFPALHTGRPWVDYWLFPLPNTMGMWPNFRSPLMWDVFAVTTYATVSALFWFMGLSPRLRLACATRAKHKWQRIDFRRAVDWAGAAMRGTGIDMKRPICCWPACRRRWCCQCIRSCRSTSATGIVPGWHTTIFPPYFVAGAVYAGFAMVLTLGHPGPQVLRRRGFHHDAPHPQYVQSDAGDRA